MKPVKVVFQENQYEESMYEAIVFTDTNEEYLYWRLIPKEWRHERGDDYMNDLATWIHSSFCLACAFGLTHDDNFCKIPEVE
jgi:hypothetical protein